VELSRFGVSCDRKLLLEFDRLTRAQGYRNRSEALGKLMRDHVLQEHAQGEAEVVGTVTLVYDHHRRELSDQLIGLQHRHHAQILSTLHIHLNHAECLEVIILRGQARLVREVADRLISTRGVTHGRLIISAAAEGH